MERLSSLMVVLVVVLASVAVTEILGQEQEVLPATAMPDQEIGTPSTDEGLPLGAEPADSSSLSPADHPDADHGMGEEATSEPEPEPEPESEPEPEPEPNTEEGSEPEPEPEPAPESESEKEHPDDSHASPSEVPKPSKQQEDSGATMASTSALTAVLASLFFSLKVLEF